MTADSLLSCNYCGEKTHTEIIGRNPHTGEVLTIPVCKKDRPKAISEIKKKLGQKAKSRIIKSRHY